MLQLFADRWTFWFAVAVILALAAPCVLCAKRKPETGLILLAVSWQIAILDAVMWIVDGFRTLGSVRWPPRASETYHALITAQLSLVIPLLALGAVFVAFPLAEIRLRRTSRFFVTSCCLCLADLVFLILYVAQLAAIMADPEHQIYREAF